MKGDTRKIIKEMCSDGEYISFLRVFSIPIIIVGLTFFGWSIINRYDIGVYASTTLISLCLGGKVLQSKVENSNRSINSSNQLNSQDTTNPNIVDN
jgi:hypothetical protein